MDFQLREESIKSLADHASVSIAFEYDRILELSVVHNGLGGFVLTERHLEVSQTKDYDSVEGGPSSWAQRFDLTNWGFIVARAEGKRIGGAVIAFDSAGVEILETRQDLAVLWDIRVDPNFRGRGVGVALFQATEKWAAKRGCRMLKVETQNINLAACKFYSKQGCTLGAVNRFAYPNLPNEIQLVWYKMINQD